MTIFDQCDPTTLERREVQLWALALSAITILAVGLALLMYPAVFSDTVILGATLRRAFFGFCALAVLLVGYLIDRQVTIRSLRKHLAEQQKRVTQIHQEASADLLETLPGFSHFQDRLAMEYKRASTTRQPLSVIIVELKAAQFLAETTEAPVAFGDAARALTRKLRGEDSIYHFARGVFGIVLPGVNVDSTDRVAGRVKEGLYDASGARARFSFAVRAINYPAHAVSAREIEDFVRAYVPKNDIETTQPRAS